MQDLSKGQKKIGTLTKEGCMKKKNAVLSMSPQERESGGLGHHLAQGQPGAPGREHCGDCDFVSKDGVTRYYIKGWLPVEPTPTHPSAELVKALGEIQQLRSRHVDGPFGETNHLIRAAYQSGASVAYAKASLVASRALHALAAHKATMKEGE